MHRINANFYIKIFGYMRVFYKQRLVGLVCETPRAILHTKSIPIACKRTPDVATFLQQIGRGCSAFSAKFATWEEFFTSSSEAMEKKGIPTVFRKYIMKWQEQYKQGKELLKFPIAAKQLKKKKFVY